jgi:hypothetical protein
MTFVAAKRFGDRVLIAADTMLSDPTGLPPDGIPGGLKAIILTPKVTVAFAGLVNPAIQAIKRAKEVLSAGGSVLDVEHGLLSATRDHLGQLEFIIASHENVAALKRIWDGRISESLPEACIGQRDLLTRLLEQEGEHPRSVVPHEFEDEGPFSFGFRKLFNGLHVSDGVGGFGLMVTCSPYGHCYTPFGGVATWDTINLGVGVTEQQWADRRSGMTQWGYNVQGPRLRGVGVVGAVVPDAGIGYIYCPLRHEKPIAWRFRQPTQQSQHGPILEAFQKEIDEVARAAGGGIEVTFPPSPNDPPTEAQLQQVLDHAAKAALPTRVSIESDSIWIECRTSVLHRSIRVGFRGLEPDPIWVLTTTIDRLNEEAVRQLRQAEIDAAKMKAALPPAT